MGDLAARPADLGATSPLSPLIFWGDLAAQPADLMGDVTAQPDKLDTELARHGRPRTAPSRKGLPTPPRRP